MNYAVISTIILLSSFVLIFFLYQTRNVSVKEISLIATLSAISGAVRIPFAALPNLQPTTFLVIISGYVFGPIFGFMVGAVAALVSNSFLGHGPWTPWQMMAWGLAGLTSGVLSKFMKKPSRFILSVFAFAWGFLFDYIMNLWHWLFLVYPLSLKSFIATYSTSFYFDLMHAIGNLLFTYILGKDFINVLMRFKDKINYIEIPVKGNNG